jgi:hypothetical protein
MKSITFSEAREELLIEQLASPLLSIGMDSFASKDDDDPLSAAEVLMMCCYKFLRKSLWNTAGARWETLLSQLRPLCEKQGSLLEEHCNEFCTKKDIASVPGGVLAVIDGRYITFTDSKLYYDIDTLSPVKHPHSPPVRISQLMLPAAYMEILYSVQQNAVEPDPDLAGQS